VLGAPALWAIQFQANYALVPWICAHGHLVFMPITTALFLVLSLSCGLISLRDWRRVGGGSAEGSAGGPVERIRFLGLLGLLVSALFSLLILAQGVAAFFINPCWS
jgi:hypothetical protein